MCVERRIGWVGVLLLNLNLNLKAANFCLHARREFSCSLNFQNKKLNCNSKSYCGVIPLRSMGTYFGVDMLRIAQVFSHLW